jgi:hypothetical protein
LRGQRRGRALVLLLDEPDLPQPLRLCLRVELQPRLEQLLLDAAQRGAALRREREQAVALAADRSRLHLELLAALLQALLALVATRDHNASPALDRKVCRPDMDQRGRKMDSACIGP